MIVALLAAGATYAQTTEPPVEDIVMLEKFSVLGKGETRATSTLANVDVTIQAPAGQNPLMGLGQLPGINVQSNDYAGLYEGGTRLRLRAFDATQVAFSFDGVPMGRVGYLLNRYITNETTAAVTLNQGSGDVSTPSDSGLGGAVNYQSANPSMTARGEAGVTVGSRDLRRYFVRADTGNVGGFAAYLAYARTTSLTPVRMGEIQYDHVEAKVTKNVGKASYALRYVFNERDDYDAYPVSQAEYFANGSDYNYFIDHYTGVPTTDIMNINGWTNFSRDHLLNANINVNVSPVLTLKFVPYYHRLENQGGRYDSLNATYPGARRLAIQRGFQNDQRGGITGRLEYEQAGPHTIAVGFWFEKQKIDFIRNRYELTPDYALAVAGSPAGLYKLDPTRIINNVFDHNYDNHSFQFYIDDKIRLMDERLTLSIGNKFLTATRDYKGLPQASNNYDVPQTYYERKRSFEGLLNPQVGASYDLTNDEQLFINYAHNYSVPGADYFQTTAFQPNLKPETADTVDVGIRTTRGKMSASLSGYYIQYHDRQFSIVYPGQSVSVVQLSAYQNVGDVETMGVEAAISWKPTARLKFSGSFTYTDSVYLNNYSVPNSSGVLQPIEVKGKTVPDTAKFMFQGSVEYKRRAFTGGINTRMMTTRYTTYLNDEQVPGYASFGLFLNWERERKAGWLDGLFVRGVVDNLLDKAYITSMRSYGARGPLANNLYGGPPRSFYLAVGAKF